MLAMVAALYQSRQPPPSAVRPSHLRMQVMPAALVAALLPPLRRLPAIPALTGAFVVAAARKPRLSEITSPLHRRSSLYGVRDVETLCEGDTPLPSPRLAADASTSDCASWWRQLLLASSWPIITHGASAATSAWPAVFTPPARFDPWVSHPPLARPRLAWWQRPLRSTSSPACQQH